MANNKKNSNGDTEARTIDLLLSWYKEARQEDRSLGERKVRLSIYSLVGFSILISIIGLCFSREADLLNVILNNIWFMLFFIFILFLMSTLFLIIALYIHFLNKYQRIYFIISEDLESKINEYISGDNNDKRKITQNDLSHLSPMERFIEEADLRKGHIFEKWYKHSLNYSYYCKKKSL